jgi:hypothetical protein
MRLSHDPRLERTRSRACCFDFAVVAAFVVLLTLAFHSAPDLWNALMRLLTGG